MGFYNLTSKEFYDKVLPYKKILPKELYKDLLATFLNLNPDSKPIGKSKPRTTKKLYSKTKLENEHKGEYKRITDEKFDRFLRAPISRPSRRRSGKVFSDDEDDSE
ncbi:hypothetical protein C1646_811390 [Rhizophagus diaphanus]|nr:hypothetical protein C1646_811390 [Rhizophagus diaphanus] [Rhizophagus sp. MUCL 43196]